MLSLKRPLAWCVLKRTITNQRYLQSKTHQSSKEVRKTFIEYFNSKDHLYVHSSSVVPKKRDGTYFINAGMNQFKPLFLGTVDAESTMAQYQRVTNYQRCVRVGGKHNDLDDVGKDRTHHTFFEMLGSWSFGNYFKTEACAMAWELLTQVYGLPPDRLYVSYFGGNEHLGLQPDLECMDIWLQLGVAKERVLPHGMNDNFWDMGETGPCGPCTEIHYDHRGGRDASTLVNMEDPEVIELWNLVFMQYDRQADGSLLQLPKQHVDTGMGLERLAAVMQGTHSNYDTDLFLPLIQAAHKCSKGVRPYSGKFEENDIDGIDTAYRLVADHMRMMFVTMSDGLVPGSRGLDHKLRAVVHRFAQSAARLNCPPGTLAKTLLPLVSDSLLEAYPELTTPGTQMDNLAEIIQDTEERYWDQVKTGKKMFVKMLQKHPDQKEFTVSHVVEVAEGRYGQPVPLHILEDICLQGGLHLDLQGYLELENQFQEDNKAQADHPVIDIEALALSHHDVGTLKQQGVPPTEDHYKWTFMEDGGGFHDAEASVVAIKTPEGLVDIAEEGQACLVVLDKTCFYAEAGGQAGDQGFIHTQNGTVKIVDTQSVGGYVVHSGEVVEGQISLQGTARLEMDTERREQLTHNHTATHILNSALQMTLGNVRQQGSSVTADKLTFDFTSVLSKFSKDHIQKVNKICAEYIQEKLPVYKDELPLDTALSVRGMRALDGENYPGRVRMVSVGQPIESLLTGKDAAGFCSVELCGGTHVNNTQDIGDIVITSIQGVLQGTKRVTAVTGDRARQARTNAEILVADLTSLKADISDKKNQDTWSEKASHIDKGLGELVLPKLDRDVLEEQMTKLNSTYINRMKNAIRKQKMKEMLETVTSQDTDEAVAIVLSFDQPREAVDLLGKCQPSRPVVLVSEGGKPGYFQHAVCYIPQDLAHQFSAEVWASYICEHFPGKTRKPKDTKKLKGQDIYLIDFANGGVPVSVEKELLNQVKSFIMSADASCTLQES